MHTPSLSETFRLLSSHPIFRGLQRDDFKPFLAMCEEHHAPANTTLYTAQQRAHSGLILLEGCIERRDEIIPSPVHTSARQSFIPGTLFCEGGFIGRWPSMHSCTTTEPTHYISIERSPFQDLIVQQNPVACSILDALLERFAQNVRHINSQLNHLYNQPDETLLFLRQLSQNTSPNRSK